MKMLGRLSYFVFFVFVCASSFAQVSPSTAGPDEARITRLGNNYYIQVTNNSHSPMSACSVLLLMYGGHNARYFYDARVLERPPINPGATMREMHPGIIVGAKLLAAVYTDGTTFGDAKQVGDLMERRRTKLAAINDVAAILCKDQTSGNSQAAISSLESLTKQAQEGGNPMQSAMKIAEYNAVAGKMRVALARGTDPFAAAFESVRASAAH